DLNPELYEVRFNRKDLFYRLVCLAERLTFRTADLVISTNASFRDTALVRGKVPSSQSVIVRTLPDLGNFRPQSPRPELREGKRRMVLYVGVMGPQDGLDLLLLSIHHMVVTNKRSDTLFVLVGPGPEVPKLKQMAADLGIDSAVRFTGPLYGANLQD